jgi:hypothetical protein
MDATDINEDFAPSRHSTPTDGPDESGLRWNHAYPRPYEDCGYERTAAYTCDCQDDITEREPCPDRNRHRAEACGRICLAAITGGNPDGAYRLARDATHFAILYLVVDIVGAQALDGCPECALGAQSPSTDGLCRCGRFFFSGPFWMDPPGANCRFCHSGGMQFYYSDESGQFLDPDSDEVCMQTAEDLAKAGIRTISAPCPVCGGDGSSLSAREYVAGG